MQIELDPLHTEQRFFRAARLLGLAPEEVENALSDCAALPYSTQLENLIAAAVRKRRPVLTVCPGGKVFHSFQSPFDRL